MLFIQLTIFTLYRNLHILTYYVALSAVVRNTLFSCAFWVAPQGVMYVAYHLVLHCLGLRHKT